MDIHNLDSALQAFQLVTQTNDVSEINKDLFDYLIRYMGFRNCGSVGTLRGKYRHKIADFYLAVRATEYTQDDTATRDMLEARIIENSTVFERAVYDVGIKMRKQAEQAYKLAIKGENMMAEKLKKEELDQAREIAKRHGYRLIKKAVKA